MVSCHFREFNRLVGRGFMVAVTEKCKDNNEAVNGVLSGGLSVPFCSHSLICVTSRRDKVGMGLFNRGSRSIGGDVFSPTDSECANSLVPPRDDTFISRGGVFGCRTGVVGSLTMGNSYVVINEYTSCVLHSVPGIIGIFI